MIPGEYYKITHPNGSRMAYRVVQEKHGIVLQYYGEFKQWRPTLERRPKEYIRSKLTKITKQECKEITGGKS